MSDSILNTVKSHLGIGEDYTPFDAEIILAINSSLMVQTQLGIGPPGGFSISSAEEKWRDFLGKNTAPAESSKMAVALRTRLQFDPPQNSYTQTTYNELIKELEWRLSIQADKEYVYEQ